MPRIIPKPSAKKCTIHIAHILVVALIALTAETALAQSPQGLDGDHLHGVRLFPRDPLTQSRFGYSAGVSGDTLVMGAFIADGASHAAGAAYVFERVNGRWVQRDKIFADDGASGDGFGSSAAISRDTIVVGAPFATISGIAGAGAAYVFHRERGKWIQQAKLPTPDPRDFGDFAGDLGVSISGDTIVVADGAAFQPPSTFGAISVFRRQGSSWNATARLTVDNEPSFATSVAIDGDDVVVGAATGNAGQISFAGAAYVFHRSEGRWNHPARLTAATPAQSEEFGFSVAIDHNQIAIGAINGRVAGHSPGAAYVFGRGGNQWRQEAKLVASDGSDFDLLGFRIAISGNTVLASAENRALGGNPAVGASYVFQSDDGNWSQAAELIPGDGTANALFGCSVAIDHATLLVGAGGQTAPAGPGAGEGYTYRIKGDAP